MIRANPSDRWLFREQPRDFPGTPVSSLARPMSSTSSRISFERCPPGDYLEALGVLYRRIALKWRAGIIADAYSEVLAGEVDLSGLWIARKQHRIIGAFLTQALAGQAAAVWPPEVEPSWNRSRTSATLIRSALDDLKSRGVVLAQALLDPENASQHAATDLQRGGLPQVTVLTYLERNTASPLLLPESVARFEWRSFSDATESEFETILESTYVGSLDMPELDGVRSLDRIREGQAILGRFEPDRWQIGRLPDEPEAAAVVLLADVPDKSAWEVAYLGLSPCARGRGLGQVALARAVELAAPFTNRLELAVDIRNSPADRLYASAGFIPFDKRLVHLAVLT